ncbi:MAG: transglutaminase-like domain-containing protein [Anaerolineales bacterium]
MSTLAFPSQSLHSNIPGLTSWRNALAQLSSEVIGFVQRVTSSLVGALGGMPVDDPAARAMLYGLGLWLLAGWAGWRVREKNDPIGGLLPVGVLTALIVQQTLQDRWLLWLHLSAFLLLLGIANLSRLLASWQANHTDYSDSIGEDSLLGAFLIAIVLLAAGYTVSTFSIKEMMDRFREQQRPKAVSVALSHPASGSSSGAVASGIGVDLQAPHRITAGPALSGEIVMFVSTGDMPPMQHDIGIQAPRYYWRSLTYQTYTGFGWSNPPTTQVQVPPNAPLLSVDPPAAYRKLHEVLTFPNGASPGAYWSGTLVESDMPLGVAWRTSPPPASATRSPDTLLNSDLIGAVALNSVGPPGQAYSFDSLTLRLDQAVLQAASGNYPLAIRDHYLPLPDSVPERVRALARDLTAHAGTPLERALAIQTYLRKIPYSLEVPAPPVGQDAVDYFLFDLKKGYCDYYATSMAVLARSVGLPSRVVLGYTGGNYDSYSARYEVTKADAHMWTEIYFAGIGWLEFEPTANQPAILRGDINVAALPAQSPSLLKWVWRPLPQILSRHLMNAGWWIITALGLYLISLLFDVLYLGRMGSSELLRRLFLRMRRLTRRMNAIPSVGQTAREYAGEVRLNAAALGRCNRVVGWLVKPLANELEALTDLYMHSLFAPQALSRSEAHQALRLWLDMRWRLGLVQLVLALGHRRFGPAAIPTVPAQHLVG